MSQAHVHSPVDETVYLRGEETAAAKRALVVGETDRIDVACYGTKLTLTLTLDDLYEYTGLLVV